MALYYYVLAPVSMWCRVLLAVGTGPVISDFFKKFSVSPSLEPPVFCLLKGVKAEGAVEMIDFVRGTSWEFLVIKGDSGH